MAMEWKGILAAEEGKEVVVVEGAAAGPPATRCLSGTIAFAPSRLSDTRYVKTTIARRIAAMNSKAVTPFLGQAEQTSLSLAVVAQFGRHWEQSSEEGSWPLAQSPASSPAAVLLSLLVDPLWEKLTHAAGSTHAPKMWASHDMALNPSAGRIDERVGTFEQSAPRNRGRHGLQV